SKQLERMLPLHSLQPEHSPGVFIEQLSLDLFALRQFPDCFDGLESLALWPRAHQIVAIASVDQLVLMTVDKIARMVFVTRQGVEARASGKVAKHVGIIAEVTIGNAAGSDFPFGIEVGGIILVILVNVRPPG